MHNIRKDFPIFNQKVNGKPLIYFDNAATSQKPQQVIDAILSFYTKYNNNIHRSVYAGGEQTTMLYEQARAKVAHYINAHPSEIIFTKGTTESINFIASIWGNALKKNDEILISQLEHHSNMVPWQECAKRRNALLRYIPILSNGMLESDAFPRLFNAKTRLVSVTHVSNALGTIVDIQTIIKAAQAHNSLVFIDAAQSAPHQKIDVKKIGCDFLAFSGHKMLGPTGIGVLYIKKELHDKISPYQYGGGMIYETSYHTATWQKAPHKFEAGTPPIAAAIGLGAAIDYLNEYVNLEVFQNHEAQLCAQLIEGLMHDKKIRILGPIDQLKNHGHLVSFTVDGLHAHDVAMHLSNHGICVRAGNHCAQPLAKTLGIAASVRASFYIYNTTKEVENFLKAIRLLTVKL